MRPPLSHFTSCPSACQTARMVSPHSAEAWLRRCSTALPVVSGPHRSAEVLAMKFSKFKLHLFIVIRCHRDQTMPKLMQKLKIMMMIMIIIIIVIVLIVSLIIVIRATIIIMKVQNNSLNTAPTQTSTNRSWCAIDLLSHDLLSLGPQQGVQWQSPSPVRVCSCVVASDSRSDGTSTARLKSKAWSEREACNED